MLSVSFLGVGEIEKSCVYIFKLLQVMMERKKEVVVVDLDPVGRFTHLCEEQYGISDTNVVDLLCPYIEGVSCVTGSMDLEIKRVNRYLRVIGGDVRLFMYEDNFSESWTRSVSGDRYYLRILTAISSVLGSIDGDISFIVVGNELVSLGRVALINSDCFIYFVSERDRDVWGVLNMINRWREEWGRRVGFRGEEKGEVELKGSEFLGCVLLSGVIYKEGMPFILDKSGGDFEGVSESILEWMCKKGEIGAGIGIF